MIGAGTKTAGVVPDGKGSVSIQTSAPGGTDVIASLPLQSEGTGETGRPEGAGGAGPGGVPGAEIPGAGAGMNARGLPGGHEAAEEKEGAGLHC